MCQRQPVQPTVPMCHWDYFSKCGAPRDQRRHTTILGGTAKAKDDRAEPFLPVRFRLDPEKAERKPQVSAAMALTPL